MSPAMAFGNIGDSVNFTCAAQGGLGNRYIWVKDTSTFGEFSSLDNYLSNVTNGDAIDVDGVLNDLTDVILSDNQYLTVTISESEDGGGYTCAAINEAGYDIDSVELTVLPYIVTHPDDVYVEASDNTSLACEADSFPSPLYQWEKYNETSSNFEELPNETNAVLTLNEISFEQNGDYRCVVTTSNGGEAISDSTTVTGRAFTVCPPIQGTYLGSGILYLGSGNGILYAGTLWVGLTAPYPSFLRLYPFYRLQLIVPF